MRNHIRREAGQYVHAAWWLVPLVFATAAVAAVVIRGGDDPELEMSTVAMPSVLPDPAITPAMVVVPASPSGQQSPAEPVYEVEHIQAF